MCLPNTSFLGQVILAANRQRIQPLLMRQSLGTRRASGLPGFPELSRRSFSHFDDVVEPLRAAPRAEEFDWLSYLSDTVHVKSAILNPPSEVPDPTGTRAGDF